MTTTGCGWQHLCHGNTREVCDMWNYEKRLQYPINIKNCNLTRNLTMEQIKGTPFEAYYVDHTVGVWPQAAGGVPFCAIEFQSKGDAITDIAEDMAAEQKARSTYDNLLRLCRDDPDVYEPLKFLREREVVHFQRFGEAMSIIQSKLDSKNFYAYNPEFKK